MFQIGDIVEIYSPQAGHKKYHLCLLGLNDRGVCNFIFINSHDGFEEDFPVENAELPMLPPSDTGISVFSCSCLVRYTEKQMTLFRAKKLGAISPDLAAKLLLHSRTVRALVKSEKQLLIDALVRLTS